MMKTEKRIQRISELIQRLHQGDDVTNSSIRRVLSEDQFTKMISEWESEKSDRKPAKPEALKDYESMLKAALLHSSKMDRFHASGKSLLAKTYALKADQAFENALNFLEEATQNEPDLLMWIDRPLNEASCDPIGIPRAIGSESFECLNKAKSPYPTRTKREIKLEALQNALSTLKPPSLECFCEPEKIVHSGKKPKIDTSGFKF